LSWFVCLNKGVLGPQLNLTKLVESAEPASLPKVMLQCHGVLFAGLFFLFGFHQCSRARTTPGLMPAVLCHASPSVGAEVGPQGKGSLGSLKLAGAWGPGESGEGRRGVHCHKIISIKMTGLRETVSVYAE